MKKILLASMLICSPLLARAQVNDVDFSGGQDAKKFADQFWTKWSSPNVEALPYIQSVIADSISFYGKYMSRDEYMKIQTAFTKRWPNRQYTVQAGSENINCEKSALTCEVSGIVTWKDTSPDRNSTSTGAAKFNFSLHEKWENGTVTFLLTGESGSVISRNVTQEASDAPMSGITSSQSLISQSTTVSVPYVGCQGGDVAGDAITPPPGHPITVNIPSVIAAKLAFYYGQNLFVLAPRGWECHSSEASGGGRSSLTVVPRDNAGHFGPAIDLENTDSDDNGTFMVTAYGGTYFPKLFSPQDVDTVIDELPGNKTSKTQFLAPKYPDDHLTYVNDSVLEYRTPPKKMGLGIAIEGGLPGPGFHETPDSSNSLFDLPIYGVVGVVKLPDFPGHYVLNLLTIRLPQGLGMLRLPIQDFTADCQPFDRQADCAGQINFDSSNQ